MLAAFKTSGTYEVDESTIECVELSSRVRVSRFAERISFAYKIRADNFSVANTGGFRPAFGNGMKLEMCLPSIFQ